MTWRGRKAIVKCPEEHTTAKYNVYDKNVSMQKVFGIQQYNPPTLTRLPFRQSTTPLQFMLCNVSCTQNYYHQDPDSR
jgi:hypothetical protein